ncbi:hypothetical protein [endosymbiont GvMRE of Glomus versiforme]|uniref:hypothetical protein n=1 Tax=endosymbiont GvMRE of Glomus versiforme TaxID=2039283 RepID=UPI000EC6475A|nr:hypothetical protein [endosymbiont GvMRE of Glomus versiforme]RHZ35914.1 hypothetical protein GvMRE_Ic4g77 [endosymbiont GvMRE of Glomus versiforme]
MKKNKNFEKALQILGQGIGPVHINEKGEIIIFDEKAKKEFSIGKLKSLDQAPKDEIKQAKKFYGRK